MFVEMLCGIAIATLGGVTLASIAGQFQTEVQAREFLERLHWPDGVRCVKCRCKLIRRVNTHNCMRKPRFVYECKVCGQLVCARSPSSGKRLRPSDVAICR